MSEQERTAKGPSLPFARWWPILAGALTGIALRLAFLGESGGRWNAMLGSFIYLVPVAVSAVTVYVAERQVPRTYGYHAVAGMLANVLFVIGTLVILIEGLICAIVIVPLFAAIGAASALAMAVISRMTRWPRQTVSCIAVLPLALGGIEPPRSVPAELRSIERSLTIAAPREVVWEQLLDVRDIQPEEISGTFAFLIGVPPPVSATTLPDQRMRRVAMGKHVYFDQEEIDRREHEHIRWRQRFHPDSFPPGSFDQHVVMGGEYFDVREVTYSLLPQGDTTKLTISMAYRVSTRFDWYAEPVARLILGNLEETLLGIYENRALDSLHRGRHGLEQGI